MKGKSFLFRICAFCFLFITVFFVIAFLWKWMDIPKTPDPAIWKGFPKEEIWRKFFSFSIPLIYGLFTLAYNILSKLISRQARDEGSGDLDVLHRSRRYDFLTYGLIPIFLLMMILWRHLGDWLIWFGGFYLSVVFIKTAILSKAIYRWIGLIEKNWEAKASPTMGKGDFSRPFPLLHMGEGAYIRWGLFLTSLLLYASVSLWINYSISPTGDEQHYLMITHSLLYDRDLDLKNNIEQGDHRKFSWVYFPMQSLIEKDGGLYSTAYNILCLLLIPGYALGSILPDYALGGRLGSLLTINLIASWLLLELFLFTAEISKSYKAGFISWAIVGFTSPVFFFSAQIYPEIIGALVLVFTLRRLLNPDFKRKKLLVAISILALISLKMRFVPIALALPLLWAFTSSQKKRTLRILWTGIATVGSAFAIIFIDKTFLEGVLVYKYFRSMARMLRILAPDLGNITALSGLIFDQEFGLLFYSPLLTFGLIGVLWFLYRYRKEVLVIVFPIFIYIYVIINLAVYDWYGGWSLPSRLIVVITPLIGLMAGIILDKISGFTTAILIRALWVWSISIVFVMTLITPWRYNSANGANILLKQAEEIFSTKITRFFPSFISPAPEGQIVFLGLLVFFIIASVLILRQKPLPTSPNLASSSVIANPLTHVIPSVSEESRCIIRGRLRRGNLINSPPHPFNKGGMGGLRSFAGGLLLLLITGGMIIMLGRSLPTRQLEGENMRHTSGIQYKDSRINVWILREKGALWDYVVLPENRAVSINIQGAGQCNTGESPHMVVKIEDKTIGEVDVPFANDFWQNFHYVFKIPPTKKGIYPFSIELTNGLNDIGKGIFCGLYVDRVEFRKEQQ